MKENDRSQASLVVAALVFVLIGWFGLPQVSNAAGEVTQVSTHTELSTPFRYTIGETNYTWGMGHNEILDSFTFRGNSYRQISTASDVAVRRVDRAGVTAGKPCSVFAERAANFTQLLPSYPADDSGSGNCDIAEMLTGQIINRGVLDIFSNVNPEPSTFNPEPKNIERIDFIFGQGIVAPSQVSLIERAGHLVSEKRGNNEIQIAAIIALDASGNPSAYGRLVRVHAAGCVDPDICYGVTPLAHNYSFFTSSAIEPQGFPVHMKDSTESVAMAYVSLKDLGINAGQRYYGFSYFPRDIDPSVHNLIDPNSFPGDTADNDGPGDGADIYGGMAAYYYVEDLNEDGSSSVNISVFVDVNNDGINDANEAGVEAVTVTLFEDTNNNGIYDTGTDIQVGDSISTDSSGSITIPGVADGDYLVLLDENDPDLPPGLELPIGSNPVLITVPQPTGTDVNFAFIPTDNGPIDGGQAPVAVSDSFPVLQGVPTTLDVLANDLDPAGGVLTIIDVTGVSTGTAMNSDAVINYQPDPDFVGETTFMYVIQNASGQQDTGMVTLIITRYSDINNNMLNDFIECDCTDLGLITGIHGSGVGALTLSSLLLWVSVFWIRRAHQRSVRRSARSKNCPVCQTKGVQ